MNKLVESILYKEGGDEESLSSLLNDIIYELNGIVIFNIIRKNQIIELIRKISQWKEVTNSIIELKDENI